MIVTGMVNGEWVGVAGELLFRLPQARGETPRAYSARI
jgi:hypothetical protein